MVDRARAEITCEISRSDIGRKKTKSIADVRYDFHAVVIAVEPTRSAIAKARRAIDGDVGADAHMLADRLDIEIPGDEDAAAAGQKVTCILRDSACVVFPLGGILQIVIAICIAGRLPMGGVDRKPIRKVNAQETSRRAFSITDGQAEIQRFRGNVRV